MITEDEQFTKAEINLKSLHERYGHVAYKTISLLPEAQGASHLKNHAMCEA